MTKKLTAGSVHWLNECIERGQREVFSEPTLLTPGLAGELLRRNPDNRYISATKLSQLVADMKAGKWAFNGEPLIVSKDGLLNDGQHRCNAIVDANKPIPTVILFGVERDTRLTVDQGKQRSAGDYMTMRGDASAQLCAGIIRLLIPYERAKGKSVGTQNIVTNAEILARFDRDPDIQKAADFASKHRSKCFLFPALIGFCFYVLANVDEDDAIAYMTQVTGGEGLNKRDPAYTVRERLLNLKNSRNDKIHVVFRGWNAFRQGRPLSAAKILGDGLPALI
jgi:hypothetical protein